MSVRTTPMIAIPLAVNLSPFAMIVSRIRNPSCNQFAHAPPMIAIPPPDVCRSLHIEIAQMTLDFANAHTARIHRDDLLVETRKSPLIFGDQLRIEGRQSVARNFKLDLGGLGENRFSAIAIPAIRAAVFLAVVEMMINLCVQGSFGKRLLQLVEQPVLRKGCLRVGSIKQLVGN